MRISDWNSDVCSSDLCSGHALALRETNLGGIGVPILRRKGDPGGVHSKDKDQGDKDDIGEATRLVQAGRRPEWTSDSARTGAIVTPPVWRASTIYRMLVVWVKSASIRLDLGGLRIIKNNNKN